MHHGNAAVKHLMHIDAPRPGERIPDRGGKGPAYLTRLM